jgi:phosphoglucomutase
MVTAYFTGKPDPTILSHRVAFGTSGHRGSAFDNVFNEAHIMAISQAICHHRSRNGINATTTLTRMSSISRTSSTWRRSARPA